MAIALVVGFLPFGDGVQPAFANTGALTIQTGGDTAPTANWTYDSGTGILSVTGTATIAPSYIQDRLGEGDLTIDALSIAVNNTIQASAGTHSLKLKATDRIVVNNDVTIETLGGGDIVFQADSDASGLGSIRLGAHLHTGGRGALTSNGGDIILSGGLDPATGFAYATTDVSPGSGSDTRAYGGVAIYGFQLNAGGGDITIRGIGYTSASTRGVMLEANDSTPGNTTIETTGDGAVTVVGQANPATPGAITNPWGIVTDGCEISTDSGDIILQGETVQEGTSPNKRGIAAVNLIATSTSGDIRIEDVSPTSVVDFTGLYFNGVTLTATAGIVAIRSDRFHSDGTTTLATRDATLYPYNPGPSFRAPITNLGIIDANEPVGGTPIELTVGLEQNQVGITVNGAVDVEGPVTINGGTVDVNNTLSASDVVTVNTWVGNLSLAQAVTSRLATGDSVRLFADKSEAVDSAGEGHIVVSGSGAISVEDGARALLYSGTKEDSTGLVDLVGGESATRTRVAAATSLGAITPSLGSTGVFALFRVGPLPVGNDRPARASSENSEETAPVNPQLAATGSSEQLFLSSIAAGLALNMTGALLVTLRRRTRTNLFVNGQ